MKVEDLFSVKGKIALVTGGSRGLGEMIARAYVENGAKVYITARKADACAELDAGTVADRGMHRHSGGPIEDGGDRAAFRGTAQA